MRPRRQNPSILQHHDLVRILDGRGAVRDDERGAALHQLVQRVLDFAFGVGVQRGCGLVQDKDARVLEEGAGDGDALALPARRSPCRSRGAVRG